MATYVPGPGTMPAKPSREPNRYAPAPPSTACEGDPEFAIANATRAVLRFVDIGQTSHQKLDHHGFGECQVGDPQARS